MAIAGIRRTNQVLRFFTFSNSPVNFLTELSSKNENLRLSNHNLCIKYFCTEGRFKPVNKSNNPNAPHQDKKKKSLTSPQVTLLTSENNIQTITLEQAEKLAQRRNLKLVKIVDFDTKTEKPLFKLMTAREFFEEDAKFKERKKKEKNLAIKDVKLFTISTKSSDHDLYVKINQIIKLLKKKHEIKIYISKDGNHARAEEMTKIIEEHVKEISTKMDYVSKVSTIRLCFKPIFEIEDTNKKDENQKEENNKLNKNLK